MNLLKLIYYTNLRMSRSASMSDEIIQNAGASVVLSNPTNILSQEKSYITTNPFIPNGQKDKELSVLQDKAQSVVDDAWNSNNKSSIRNLTLDNIFKNMAMAPINLFTDLFNKPENISWLDYIPLIIQRDQRYAYIGLLIIFITLFYILITYKSTSSIQDNSTKEIKNELARLNSTIANNNRLIRSRSRNTNIATGFEPIFEN